MRRLYARSEKEETLHAVGVGGGGDRTIHGISWYRACITH